MTKKEQAEVAAMKAQLQLFAALRWTEEVKPDVPIPTDSEITRGWVPGYRDAIQAISTALCHYRGSDAHEGKIAAYSWSRDPWALYSTRLLALRALRHDMELLFAKDLAAIDRLIEREAQG